MLRRIAILGLLLVTCRVATAQNDSILVNGRDTIAYTYTPLNITSPQNQPLKRRNKGWERFVNYIIESSEDNSFERKVDLTFIPGLYYTNSTSAGLVVVASGLYRLDKENRSLPASDFSVYATASLTGFYRVGIKGNNIFRDDRRRITYNTEFYSQPLAFWGLGYGEAMQNSSVHYNGSRCYADIRYTERIAKGLYIGVGADFDYLYTRKVAKDGGEEYASFLSRLNGQHSSYHALGISLLLEYDTRDFIQNPERGVHISLQGKIRPKGTSNIGRTTFQGRLVADYYQRLWKGAILALDLRGEVNSNGTPWSMYATLGGASSMRGYYAGRFSDLCSIALQAELRQRIYKRLGGVVWGGAGNVFAYDNFAWRNTMPNYGVGLRFELKRRINIRLDYGFGGKDGHGKLIHGAIFSVNEAF